MLQKYREQIDMIDEKIIELIWKRMQISKSIGIYKQEHNLPALQSQRREEVLSDRLEQAEQISLDPNCIQEIYEIIHKYSLLEQE